MKMLFRNLVILAGAGLGLYALKSGFSRQTDHAARPMSDSDAPPVRPAGPQTLRDEPKDWDMVDERADESFPASDPPGTY